MNDEWLSSYVINPKQNIGDIIIYKEILLNWSII